MWSDAVPHNLRMITHLKNSVCVFVCMCGSSPSLLVTTLCAKDCACNIFDTPCRLDLHRCTHTVFPNLVRVNCISMKLRASNCCGYNGNSGYVEVIYASVMNNSSSFLPVLTGRTAYCTRCLLFIESVITSTRACTPRFMRQRFRR